MLQVDVAQDLEYDRLGFIVTSMALIVSCTNADIASNVLKSSRGCWILSKCAGAFVVNPQFVLVGLCWRCSVISM
jgi:hypothetical protein